MFRLMILNFNKYLNFTIDILPNHTAIENTKVEKFRRVDDTLAG